MGSEFGQFIEWKYDDSLDWHLLNYPMHLAMHDYVRQLNGYYVDHPELWEEDCDWSGFSWISCDDNDNSAIAFFRTGKDEADSTVVLCNFTPVVRHSYRIGVPVKATTSKSLTAMPKPSAGRTSSMKAFLPPRMFPCTVWISPSN